MVTELSLLKSMPNLWEPFGLFTNTGGEVHGELEGSITPLLNMVTTSETMI